MRARLLPTTAQQRARASLFQALIFGLVAGLAFAAGCLLIVIFDVSPIFVSLAFASLNFALLTLLLLRQRRRTDTAHPPDTAHGETALERRTVEVIAAAEARRLARVKRGGMVILAQQGEGPGALGQQQRVLRVVYRRTYIRDN